MPVGDEEALYNGIKELLSKNSLDEMGKHNKEKAQNYSEDVIIQKWKEEIFNCN